jgi:hypothetical protein
MSCEGDYPTEGQVLQRTPVNQTSEAGCTTRARAGNEVQSSSETDNLNMWREVMESAFNPAHYAESMQ